MIGLACQIFRRNEWKTGLNAAKRPISMVETGKFSTLSLIHQNTLPCTLNQNFSSFDLKNYWGSLKSCIFLQSLKRSLIPDPLLLHILGTYLLSIITSYLVNINELDLPEFRFWTKVATFGQSVFDMN